MRSIRIQTLFAFILCISICILSLRLQQSSSLLLFPQQFYSHQEEVNSYNSNNNCNNSLQQNENNNSNHHIDNEEYNITTQRKSYFSRMEYLFYNYKNIAYGQYSPRAACEDFDNFNLLKLYQNNKNSSELFTNCMNALEYAQQQNDIVVSSTDNNNETITLCDILPDNLLFHVIWIDGELPPTAKLSIISIIYHHQQCSQLIIWTTNEHTKMNLEMELSLYTTNMNQFGLKVVIVKIINEDELIDKVSNNFPDLSNQIQLSKSLWKDAMNKKNYVKIAAYSDIIRVLLLASYGGIYIDCDVLILQSLYPLILYDFYYRWSVTDYANTAIFHLQYQSNNTRLLLLAILTQTDFAADLFHPQTLSKILISLNSTVQLLPTSYFDPLWIIKDVYSIAAPIALKRYMLNSFELFFDNNPLMIQKQLEQQDQYFLLHEQFFPGAFAFHWHNQWHSIIKNESIAASFVNFFIDEQKKKNKQKK